MLGLGTLVVPFPDDIPYLACPAVLLEGAASERSVEAFVVSAGVVDFVDCEGIDGGAAAAAAACDR